MNIDEFLKQEQEFKKYMHEELKALEKQIIGISELIDKKNQRMKELEEENKVLISTIKRLNEESG